MKKFFSLTAALLITLLSLCLAQASGIYQSKAYHLDGDDWYNLYYGENLYVRVDEADLPTITSDKKVVRLTLTPATPLDVTVVYLPETMEYEFTIGDIDPSASLYITIENYQTHAVEETLPLFSGSVIRIRAAAMEAVFHDGGSNANSAWEEIRLEQLDGGALRYDLEQSGDFFIVVQKKVNFDTSHDPGPFTPAREIPVETPEATPPGDDTIDVGDIPAPAPTAGNPSPSTSDMDHMMLGGGGSVFSCSLSTEGSTFNLDMVALGMVGLLGALQLFRKNKVR